MKHADLFGDQLTTKIDEDQDGNIGSFPSASEWTTIVPRQPVKSSQAADVMRVHSHDGT